VVEYRKSLCLTPQSKRSRFEIYREAWHLMGQPRTGPAKPEPLVSGATRITDP
jgi:hypothetical protein